MKLDRKVIITLLIFIVAFLIGVKLRVLNPWHFIFTKWGTVFLGNDPWYYYRLTINCLHNFPKRLWFDAFTYYPYGTYVHFGPFLVYLGAILCKLFGATTPLSARNVLVFVPTIAGTLLFLPVYLLTREVSDDKTALIAAIAAAVLPGQTLYRGELGFNDHHIWEVFWMVLSLGTFLYSYNKLKGKDIDFRKHWIYLILPGIPLGLYLLAWAPGCVTALIISSCIFIAFIFKKFIDIDFKAAAYTSSISFLVAALIYLPFAFNYPGLSLTRYSPTQLLILIGCSIGVFILYLLDKWDFSKYIKNTDNYIISRGISLVLLLVAVIGAYLINPAFLRLLEGMLHVITPKAGQLTIAEAQPFFAHPLSLNLEYIKADFGYMFYFAILGYIIAAYQIYNKREFKHILLLWWGIIMFIALAGQARFAYYYGAVSAIFGSFALGYILYKLDFYNKFLEFLSSINHKEFNKKAFIRTCAGIILLGVMIYPTYEIANLQSMYVGGAIPKQWYDALIWMRNNTPNATQYNQYFYEIYKPPKFEDWLHRKPYPYPFKTYGVISWWDYGHWITTIAHRMPIANPFQQGIGNKYNNVPGAAPFFTAFNESYADKIANELNVKYVISDIEMATGKFYAMATWAEGSLEKADLYMLWPIKYEGQYAFAPKRVYLYVLPNGSIGISQYLQLIPLNAKIIGRFLAPGPLYYKTMEARLHILDGIGLKHYRMVYESAPPKGFFAAQEIVDRIIYNKYFANNSIEVPIEVSGYVKIFEYVKGAEIIGYTNSTSKYAEIYTKIKTNQNRTFIYYQKVPIENGTFEFIVPYAQQTKYPVKPTTPYIIRVGNETKQIILSDEDVETGRKIIVYI